MELAVVGLYSFLIAKQSRVIFQALDCLRNQESRIVSTHGVCASVQRSCTGVVLHTKYAGAGDLIWN
ncbi:MAG: hypothetical protein DNFNHJIP_00348 [Candidatus Argoarchaeum ethanivorans]|uniref:Uncharacterized protein n=1 Tax=Candidatus Argoarchaeum ethanivorans TaxID=2608793 RepID=A0A811ZZY2_9EURY|nr:MAG: hypothetical protein DNFNHJIP_00348 [Candidatus Argoarchaeum ethanivorans]